MRIRPRIMVWLLATAFASAAVAAHETPLPTPPDAAAKPHSPRAVRFLAFRSLTAQLDNRVVANLLTESPLLQAETPLAVVAGEITRCESRTCNVPLTLRVSGAEGPITVALAVANAKGELSDVHHTDCGTGACSFWLVLERGRNIISVGVIDGLSQATSYTTLRVNAARAVAAAPGKTEWF